MFSVSGPKIGVRCSSVVRVFAHGVMGHWSTGWNKIYLNGSNLWDAAYGDDYLLNL